MELTRKRYSSGKPGVNKIFFNKERGKTMKKGKRILALLLAMVMCVSCFTACGGSGDTSATEAPKNKQTAVPDDQMQTQIGEEVENNSDAEQIELKVWAPTDERLILETLCEKFDGIHPEYDITFVYEEVEEPNAYTQISKDTEMAADVFYFANDQLSNLVEGNYIMALPEKIQERVEANFDSAAVESCKVDGKLYSIPFTANVWYLFYNKSMFTEEEVKDLDVMMAKEIPGCDYNFSIPLNNGWYINGFFLGGGCTLFGPNGDDPTQCDWASDRGVAIVNYLNSLMNSGKLYKDDGNADTIGLLTDGKCASFCTGSWKARDIKAALGENYGAVKLPQFTYEYNGEKVTKDIAPFGDYKSIGVKKDTAHPAAAAQLAEFLAGDYSQEQRLAARAISPTYKTIMDLAVQGKYDDPAVKAGVDQTSTVIPRPTIPQLANYWTPAATIGACVVGKNEQVTTDDATTLAFLGDIVKMITATK